MRTTVSGLASLVCTVALTAFAATDGAQDGAVKEARQKIQGTWRAVTLEVGGTKAADSDARKITVVNGSDGTWSLRSEGKEIAKGTSTIDPAKSPKTIDFTATEGDAKGKKFVGIYELGETTRRLCFAPAGEKRPASFSTSPGTEQILVGFERVAAK